MNSSERKVPRCEELRRRTDAPPGSSWYLFGPDDERRDELAEDCANDGFAEFMVTAKPLHVRGGVGSPPNALATK